MLDLFIHYLTFAMHNVTHIKLCVPRFTISSSLKNSYNMLCFVSPANFQQQQQQSIKSVAQQRIFAYERRLQIGSHYKHTIACCDFAQALTFLAFKIYRSGRRKRGAKKNLCVDVAFYLEWIK